MRFFYALLALLIAATASAQRVNIQVHVDRPTVEISPHLYGLFYEDINFSADGGLYAELVQNRSFEYYAVQGGRPLSERYHPLWSWEKVELWDAACEIGAEKETPLNSNNPTYLTVSIDRPGEGAGVKNHGFDGIRLDKGEEYRLSLYARWQQGRGGPLTVTLLDKNGNACSPVELPTAGGDWSKSDAVLTADRTTDKASLSITTTGQGKLCLDMVSLFPVKTFKGRENGLRPDLAQALADLNPKFFRFPGGCVVHGHGLQNAYRWKDTVGDVAERRPNWNRWGYHQTYGLGYFEYFQLCEDIGAHPLPVLPVGVSCGFNHPYEWAPLDELHTWVQDAVDLIEFANGPVDSKWGKVRAQMGHPEPFNVEFICLGNEEHDTPEFAERFPYFVHAVRRAYPEIKIIGTSGLDPQIPLYPQMRRLGVYSSDEHYYQSPEWFVQHQDRFDHFDRDAPKIFVGEYASRGNQLRNAVAEAAYLTGVERNADLVDMACYAPLLAHVHHTQWTAANLIYFDKRTVVKTPNYHVQQLFSLNKGDEFLKTDIQLAYDEQDTLVAGGAVGIGTWLTSVEIRDAKVDDQPLDAAEWRSRAGDFTAVDGAYRQRDASVEGAISVTPKSYGGDKIVYQVQAKKLDGREGFLVVFGYEDDRNFYWWNVGGWDNSRHSIERSVSGVKRNLANKNGSIESGRWYDLRVELTPHRIRCFLDDELVHDIQEVEPRVSVSSTRDKQSGEVILKLVNPSIFDLQADIKLSGASIAAGPVDAVLLTGNPLAGNSIDEPENVKPTTIKVDVSDNFQLDLPAGSVQALRAPVERAAAGE